MDEEILTRFKEFQQLTGQYQDLDLEEVECEEIDFFNHPSIKLIGSKKLANHNELDQINDEGGLPVYDASVNVLTHVREDRFPNCVFEVLDETNPFLSFANEGNSSAGTNFIFHTGKFFANNHRTVINFSESNFYSRFVFYVIKDMKQEYGFKRGYIPSQEELSKLQIKVPIPKDLNEKYSSLEIQKALVAFIAFKEKGIEEMLYHLGVLAENYQQLRSMVLPLTFGKDPEMAERFNKWSQEDGQGVKLEEVEFEQKPLEKVAELTMGQSPTGKELNTNGKGLPFHQGKTLYGDKYLKEPKVWTEHSKRKAFKGDILVSMRAPAGAINIASYETSIGRGLAAARPKKGLHFDFLYFLLKDNEIKIGADGDTGGMFTSITTDYLKSLEVNLPLSEKIDSLKLQEELIAFITQAYSEVGKKTDTIKWLEKAIPEYKQLFISVLFYSLKNQA